MIEDAQRGDADTERAAARSRPSALGRFGKNLLRPLVLADFDIL